MSPSATSNPLRARILVVDDESICVKTVVSILTRAGYSHVEGLTDPCLAEERFRDFAPDLVLLDLHMPGMDGLQVLQKMVAATPESTYLPVVMLTGDDRSEAREQALSAGARDFIGKPFHRAEVLLRIKNFLETRALHRELADKNHELEARVAARTAELADSQLEVLERLARAAEYRDDDTGQHTQRVAEMAARLAAKVSVPPAEVDLIARAAPLHDVGKIGVPDSILLKQGRLNPDEMAVMKRHTIIGATMLCGGHSRLVHMAETIARSHHEWWNGAGYPDGIAGEAIPLCARIVAIVDFFDALTHARPYRPAMSLETTLAEVGRMRGQHFDPALVDAFFQFGNHAAFV
ncbi:MAG TPA: HD domain-containing phosphohydrolase [Gemmatimonadales bacterium]